MIARSPFVHLRGTTPAAGKALRVASGSSPIGARSDKAHDESMEHDTLRPEEAPPVRRLYRNPRNKMIAGVCGGLGHYFGIDPVVFRIGFAALSLLGGSGVLLYVIFWVVVPEWGDDSSMGERLVHRGPHRSAVGLILLAIAAIAILHTIFESGVGTAITFMVAGAALLLWKRDDGTRADADFDDDDGDEYDEEYGEEALSSGYVRYETTPRPPKPPRPRSYLGRLTIAIVLLVSGVLALGTTTGLFDISLDTALAVALLITGAGLIVGAWFGRSRGLIVVGVLLTLLLAAATFIDVPLRGAVGDRRYSPDNISEVRDEYRMIVGEMRLDLSDVEFPRGDTEIDVSMAAGEMRVLLPRGIDVEVKSHLHVGEALVLTNHQEGFDLESTNVDDVDGRPGRLLLRIDMGAGRVQVGRAAA